MIAQKVVRPSQLAFMPGRYILEGVVVLHETLFMSFIGRKRIAFF
jgi:hypothetical protein